MSYIRAIEFFQWLFSALMIWALSYMQARAETNDDDDDDDYDPLPGRSKEQIDALIFNFDEVVESIALYTALFALLAMLLALASSMRLRRWGMYIILAAASLAWFAVVEQHATGLYWVGFDLSDVTLTFIGIPLISLHFFLAGWYISATSRFYFLRPALLLAAALPWIALALRWPGPTDPMPLIYIVLGALACASHLLTIPRYDAETDQSIYTKRNAIVVLLALAITAFVIFGELDEELDLRFIIRSLFVATVCLLAFFLVQFVITVLRERDASVRNSLKIAQREAEQSRALLEAEKNYARAKDVARRHTMRLATASHDIRQPIMSLRSTMASVAQDQSQEVQSQLRAAFDYLDDLAKSYMETDQVPNHPGPPASDANHEVISSKVLCNTLDRMFRKEAERKGLTFDVSVVDQDLSISPLVLTRILSNLMSNAVKHTASGQVSLTAQPNAGGYLFVVANSSKMPKAVLDADPMVHGVAGEVSEGSGFGLAIVKKLSQSNGLDLDWSSNAETGTEFRLSIKNGSKTSLLPLASETQP